MLLNRVKPLLKYIQAIRFSAYSLSGRCSSQSCKRERERERERERAKRTSTNKEQLRTTKGTDLFVY